MNAFRARGQRKIALLAAAILSAAVLLAGCEGSPEQEAETSQPLSVEGHAWTLLHEDGVYIAYGWGDASFTEDLDEGKHAVCVNAPGRSGTRGSWRQSLARVTVRRGSHSAAFAFHSPSFDMFTPTQILAEGGGTTMFNVKIEDRFPWLIRVEALDRHREHGGCPPLAATR